MLLLRADAFPAGVLRDESVGQADNRQGAAPPFLTTVIHVTGGEPCETFFRTKQMLSEVRARRPAFDPTRSPEATDNKDNIHL